MTSPTGKSIQEEVQRRQARANKLDPRVAEISRDLVRSEIRNHETFIENEYFLMISDEGFSELSPPEQALCLALWHVDRTQNVPGHRFSFQPRKKIDGLQVACVASLQCGAVTYRIAVELDLSEDKRAKLAALKWDVIGVSSSDVLNRPVEAAEDVFRRLSDRAACDGHA